MRRRSEAQVISPVKLRRRSEGVQQQVGIQSPAKPAVGTAPATEQRASPAPATEHPRAGERDPSKRYILNAWEQDGELRIVEQLEGGRAVVRTAPLDYALFVDCSDEKVRERLSAFEHECRHSPFVKGLEREGKWLRISARDSDARRALCRYVQDKLGWQSYEGDIAMVRRWLTDQQAVVIAQPRRLYYDLETDPRPGFSRKQEMRVLIWCAQNQAGEQFQGVLEEDTDAAEARLLGQYLELIEDYDQLIAWNGARFDKSVLWARIMRLVELGLLQLKHSLRRPLWLDHLAVFQRQNMMGAESGEEKQSMALNSIAKALGVGEKDDFDARTVYEEWAAGGERRERAVRYCRNDVALMPLIEQKTGYIELHHSVCEVCRVFPDDQGVNPSLQVEGFLLSLARARDFKFASRLERTRGEQFRGAYVMKPKFKGILKNVHVCDFSTMYPSIIVSWNMSPDTKVPHDAPDGPGMSTSPITGVRFYTEKRGILADAVLELMRLRKYWSDLEASLSPGSPEAIHAHRMSSAYKIATNSFYGVVGSPMSTFFDVDVAESITQAGAFLIQAVIELGCGPEFGFQDVYADTDGADFMGCTEERFGEFTKHCNEVLFPKILAEHGCVEARLKLAYEKAYERIIFSAAKKYCARILHFKGTRAKADAKPEVKGLEYKRGDSVRLARELQKAVVDKLIVDCCEDPAVFGELVGQWQARIINGQVELADCMMSKRIGRPLGDYAQGIKKDGTAKRQLPHVELAKKLVEAGEDADEGAKIEYYLADGGVKPAVYKPAAEWADDVDRFGLWDDQVYKPTQRVLEAAFPDADWKLWARSRPKKPRAPRAKRAVA